MPTILSGEQCAESDAPHADHGEEEHGPDVEHEEHEQPGEQQVLLPGVRVGVVGQSFGHVRRAGRVRHLRSRRLPRWSRRVATPLSRRLPGPVRCLLTTLRRFERCFRTAMTTCRLVPP